MREREGGEEDREMSEGEGRGEEDKESEKGEGTGH